MALFEKCVIRLFFCNFIFLAFCIRFINLITNKIGIGRDSIGDVTTTFLIPFFTIKFLKLSIGQSILVYSGSLGILKIGIN